MTQTIKHNLLYPWRFLDMFRFRRRFPVDFLPLCFDCKQEFHYSLSALQLWPIRKSQSRGPGCHSPEKLLKHMCDIVHIRIYFSLLPMPSMDTLRYYSNRADISIVGPKSANVSDFSPLETAGFLFLPGSLHFSRNKTL